MSAHPRKALKEFQHLLDEYGIKIVDEHPCTKHRKLIISDGRAQRMLIFSHTSVSRRGLANAVSTARQILREAP